MQLQWRLTMMSLTDKAWSPYAAGILIGLLQIPAFLLVNTALGASSSYVTAAGTIAALFDSGVGEIAYFKKYMTSSKYVWQSALVIGVGLGAFASARISGAGRQAFSPIWRKAVGITAFPQRALMAFVGGFVLLFGARLAGGCTSGHGLSGMAQLSVGSTVAVMAMFAGGILTAMMMRRI
ncbi:MAG: YeeE/YedE thiosulfate transporter family protein [Methyloligellaceae bacterium]